MATFFSKFREVLGLQEPEFEAIAEDYSEIDSRDFRSLYEDENVRDEYGLPPRRRRTVSPHDAPPRDISASRLSRPSRDRGSDSGKVIGLPGVQNVQGEVILLNPTSFEEMADVISHLRDRKAVVMNLNLMDPADAQRSVDFVAGETYAIEGNQERIGENIFLFTPSCVAVTTQPNNSGAETSERVSSPAADMAADAPTPQPATSYWPTAANG